MEALWGLYWLQPWTTLEPWGSPTTMTLICPLAKRGTTLSSVTGSPVRGSSVNRGAQRLCFRSPTRTVIFRQK